MPATTARPVTEELAELRAAAAELHDLGHIVELLGWDQETMMPAKGVDWRGYQQSTLSGIIHERLTAPKLGDLLASLAEAAAETRLAALGRRPRPDPRDEALARPRRQAADQAGQGAGRGDHPGGRDLAAGPRRVELGDASRAT